jgi:hypothetical protein
VACAIDGVVSSGPQPLYSHYTDLHLQIVSQDGDFQVDTSVSRSGAVEIINFEHIPEGSYTLTAWTTDADGDTIHAPVEAPVDITKKEIQTVTLHLLPLVGSIMAQLYNLPTTIDSVIFAFSADSGFFEDRQERSPRMILGLDKIPFGALGTISLTTLRENSDTMSHWDTLFTFTNENTSIEIDLINNGDMDLDIIIDNTPVTIFTGSGDTTFALGREVERGLVITEFCATGGGHGGMEFVEIQNLSGELQSIDSLYLIHNERRYSFGPLSLEPDSFYVIGSLDAREVWEVDTVVNISLASTSGALFLYDTDVLLDYLIYFNNYEQSGWPYLSSSARTSWYLSPDLKSPRDNNFGTHWQESTHLYKEIGDESWYGNPKGPGM